MFSLFLSCNISDSNPHKTASSQGLLEHSVTSLLDWLTAICLYDIPSKTRSIVNALSKKPIR